MKNIFIVIFLFLSTNLLSQKIKIDTLSLFTKKVYVSDLHSFDTLGIDTNQRHIELSDRFSTSLYPLINLGQNASPTIETIFFKRNRNENFWFFTPFQNFIQANPQIVFYKTNKPYTDIHYLFGQKLVEEQYLNIIHTQTFNDSVNFGFNIKMYAALNLFTTKDNNSVNNVNVWFFKKFKKFDFYVSYYLNSIKFSENGGFADTAADFNYFDANKHFNIENSAVKNSIKNNGVVFFENFKISKKFSLQHNFNYINYKKIFSETTVQQIFGTPQINSKKTLDSIALNIIENNFAFVFNTQKTNFFVGFTNSINHVYFYQGFLFNLNGEYFTDNYISGGFRKIVSKIFDISAFGKFHFTGRYIGNIYQTATAKIFLFKNLYLQANQRLENYQPDYFLENYNGNYQQWSLDLKNIQELNINVQLKSDKYNFALGVDNIVIANYIYFDTTLVPQQISTPINISTAFVSKSFRLKPLVFDLEVYYQKCSNNQIVNIPEITAGSSLYFDFALFKRAMLLNIGANVAYTTQFYMYNYSPTLGIFYQNNEIKTSQFPYINAFLTAKIKTAIVIIRLENAAGMIYQPYYATTQHYIMPILNLRFGVRWWFRN